MLYCNKILRGDDRVVREEIMSMKDEII